MIDGPTGPTRAQPRRPLRAAALALALVLVGCAPGSSPTAGPADGSDGAADGSTTWSTATGRSPATAQRPAKRRTAQGRTTKPRPTTGRSPGTTPPAPAPQAAAGPAAPPGAWADAVRAENALPGSRLLITKARGTAPGLEAFADRVSVRPGEDVGLYVSAAGRVSVTALRYGWYGGALTRPMWSGEADATVQPRARRLTGPVADLPGVRDTRAAYAPWTPTLLVPTTGWPEGEYLLRVDTARASRYVPLVVRSADAAGRVLLVTSALTSAAYNTWGGAGLYGDEDKDFARRSLAVSLDRPDARAYGAGGFLMYDAPVVAAAERLGLPLAWASDYDVALDPHLLDGASAVVFGGHAEYWTAPLRARVAAAVAAGTNLAVFGANTAYWRVRLGGAATASTLPARRDGRPRLVFGPKDPRLDPLAASDPAGATARFRDRPSPAPEAALLGQRYDCFPAEADWVVADASWWGYAGTGLRTGDRLRGLVGPESDRYDPRAPGAPQRVDVVARSPLTCGRGGPRTWHTAISWTAPSGAGVFAAGTLRWPDKLGDPVLGPVVTRITSTVLETFSRPRAGLAAATPSG